jgi:hypothetical protein
VQVILADFIQQSRIPDPIKMLPNYEGDPKTLNHWIHSTSTVLAAYEPVRLQDPIIYNIWVMAIRQKIIGKANEALVSRNIATDWGRIREVLIEYFGDRRDLSTLSAQIPYLRQGNKNLDEFYKETSELTANINTKVSLDPRFPDANQVNAVMTFVRDLTKSSFIDGLNEPLNLTVRSFRPTTLEEAKSAAEEQLQSIQRNRIFNSNTDGKFSVFSQNSQRQQVQKKNPNRQQNPKYNQASNQASNFVPRQNNSQNFTPNFTPNFNRNANGNFNNGNARFNNPSNFQNHAQRQVQGANPTQADNDVSMRSRQSAQPMSISARNYQLANVEQQVSYENTDDYNENCDECPDSETNFHLEMANLSTG